MVSISDKLVDEAKVYVINLLDRNLSEKFYYHNRKHTLDVLNNAEIIGNHYRLNKADYNLLRLSAIFHDVGYVDQYQGHEEKSAARAAEYLQSKGIDESNIEQVVRAILSTRIPQQPHGKISEILCDADLMYLADQSNYFTDAELLKKEWAGLNIVVYNELEFHANSLDFFQKHLYHTEYGKMILRQKKEQNKKLISKKVLETEKN